MTFLTRTDHVELTFPRKRQEPSKQVHVECGRLIHAAVINKRFQKMLLTNPVKTIEEGYCGEKFAFTHDEKQRIRMIQADTLAEFSSQLLQAIEQPTRIPAQTPEMAFAW